MAWNHLQSASTAATSSSSNSATVTFTTANLSSGSKMIIAIGWASGSAQTVSTVKDGAGNSFTRMAGAPNSGGPSGCDLWQLDTPAGDVGTKPTITVQFSGSVSASLLVQEVSGLATGTTTAAVLDGTAGTKTGSGGSSTGSPTYSSSLSSEYLVTVYGDDGGPETLGTPSPPGNRDTSTVSANSFADVGIGYGNSTGTVEAGSWPLSGTSAEWGVVLVAFKLAAGGTTVTASGDGAAVATRTAAGATTKPASGAQQAVAAGHAAGASTKPVSASRPAVATISASATAGAPTVTGTGTGAAVAATRAAGASTKPAAASRPAVAAGKAAGATTKPVSATRPAVAAISAAANVGPVITAGGGRPAVAAISATASVGVLNPTVVQQVSGSSTSDYGMSSVPISTTAGNGIVVFAGWDVHNAPTDGPIPALYVADSAGNYWYHLGTSGVGGYGSRCTVWACPNARSVSWVSASLTAFASSLAYLVVEISNFPQFFDLDAEDDAFLNAGVPSTQTFTTPGPGSWTAQTGVTSVNAQCWAAGGGGQQGDAGTSPQGGAGGGGGEYAQEATLAVTPGNSYAYTVGAAGAGGSTGGSVGGTGGNTVFHGASVTVTAHGGGGGHNSGGGSGGSGSTNTVHHGGGNGGGQSTAFHGVGGGGSGGTSSAGNAVATDVKTAALPVTGGGPGGPGGNSTSPFYGYYPANPPGGGGGGGGANNKSQGNGGRGGAGQIVLTYTATGPETLALSATTTAADLGFTMLCAGVASAALTSGPGSPWVALDTVTAGGAIDGVTIFPYWDPSIAASTNLTPSWTLTAQASIAGVLGTIDAVPPTPTQSNPSFPNLKVEIAEGFQPGDPTAGPPTWTDITARCMGKSGDSFITVTYGQQYELATPEAGEMVIGVNNLDGAFTPGNSTSPYSPYVVLGMPVRVSAYWDGTWYQVGFGYVERWPTEWPDLPQWGLSKLTCTDSIAVLNSATMPSALQGDILADGPYTYLPLNEQYLTYINGLTTSTGSLNSYSSAEAAGLLAANLSRVNQRAGAYCDGITATMETGSALNLFGDQGTGAGASSISGNVSYTTPATGPGVIYNDPAMPDPLNADGVSIELWFVYSLAETSGQGLTLFQAFGTPSSYWPTASATPTATPPTSFAARILSTSNEIQLELNGTNVNAGTFIPSGNPQQLVFAFPSTGAGSSLLVYYNGTLLATISVSAGETTAWQAAVFGPATYAYSAAPLVQNFTEGHCVIYPYTLPAARVAAHYSTGAAGAAGSTVSQGAAQILAWGYLGIPRGGPTGFGPAGSQISDGIALGPFYSLDGSSAGDGLNAAILSDGGMMYAAPSGVLTVLPRWALFNEAVTATLGDATDGSQVPYQMGQAYDFDNTYLYNIVSVTRNDGPTTSITVTVRNAASQLAYFTRSALQQTISTSSDEDAYTLSNWEAGQYAQPQMRVRQLSIDAASNPAVAFPAVLPMTVSNVVNVDRDPVGGVPISGQFLTQRVSISIGPTLWKVDLQLSPYVVQAAVLTSDSSTYNEIGLNALG